MKKRAKFNLSNFHNCTFKLGYLYPVNLFEVLPGDSIQLSTSVFLRLAPMVVPVMHPVYMHLSNFFVPSRVLWSGFEDFITGGPDGSDTSLRQNAKKFAFARGLFVSLRTLKRTTSSV